MFKEEKIFFDERSCVSERQVRIIIAVAITSQMYITLCWSHNLTYVRGLPRLFSYSALLHCFTQRMPFDGEFIQLSGLDDFFLSVGGCTFWRRPLAAMKLYYSLQIVYNYSYKSVVSSRNVNLFFLNSTRTYSLIDCSRLQGIVDESKDSINLEKFLPNDSIVYSENWITPKTLFSTKYPIKSTTNFVVLSPLYYQTCKINSVKRPKEFRYFRTEETEKGAKIGDLNFNESELPSRFILTMVGPHASLFSVSSIKRSLHLTD